MLMNATMMFVMLILTVPTLLRIYEGRIFELQIKTEMKVILAVMSTT